MTTSVLDRRPTLSASNRSEGSRRRRRIIAVLKTMVSTSPSWEPRVTRSRSGSSMLRTGYSRTSMAMACRSPSMKSTAGPERISMTAWSTLSTTSTSKYGITRSSSFPTVPGTVSPRSTHWSAWMTSAVTLSLRKPSTKKRTARFPPTSISRSRMSKVMPTPRRRRTSSRVSSNFFPIGVSVVRFTGCPSRPEKDPGRRPGPKVCRAALSGPPSVRRGR